MFLSDFPSRGMLILVLGDKLDLFLFTGLHVGGIIMLFLSDYSVFRLEF